MRRSVSRSVVWMVFCEFELVVVIPGKYHATGIGHCGTDHGTPQPQCEVAQRRDSRLPTRGRRVIGADSSPGSTGGGKAPVDDDRGELVAKCDLDLDQALEVLNDARLPAGSRGKKRRHCRLDAHGLADEPFEIAEDFVSRWPHVPPLCLLGAAGADRGEYGADPALGLVGEQVPFG